MGHGGVERVEGFASGADSARAIARELETRAAILPDDSALRQHAARPEFEIDALDEAHREPIPINGAEPDRVASARGLGPGQGLIRVDSRRQLIELARVQICLRVLGHGAGIADDPVAHQKGLLG